MVADLFSVSDFMFGSSVLFLSLFLWLSSICIVSYICFVGSFWYLAGFYGSLLFSTVGGFVGFLSDQKFKIYGGGPHLMFTLGMVLLSFNLVGGLPFMYSLTSHFIISFSFSIPFWLVTVLLHLNVNWRSFGVAHIYEGVPSVALAMIIIAEWISVLARPVTLAVRISMNVFIGQVIMSMISAMSTGIFYSFFSMGGFISGFCLFVSMGLFLVEMAIGLVQVCIFVGLLIFYLQEVFMEG